MATIADRTEGSGTVSIGRVFSRAFSFVREYPLLSLGSAALFGAVPSVLSQLYMATQAPALLQADGDDVAAVYGVIVVQVVLGLVSFILSGLLQAIITRGFVEAHEGGRPTFGRSMVEGLRFAIPVVLLTMLWSLGAMVGFMLLFVPGIILVCMWAVAIPALVEERTGIVGAFGRSRELTRGNRWKVFGLLFVLLAGFYLLVGLLALVAAGLGEDLVLDGQAGYSVWVLVSSAISGLIFGLFWATIQPSLFVELRDAKEGGSAAELAQVFS